MTERQLLEWARERSKLQADIKRLETHVWALTDALKREMDLREQLEEKHRGCQEIRRIALMFQIPQAEVVRALEETARIFSSSQGVKP